MTKQCPIGIFDSGVGGLSVTREIRRLLPGEDILYFADSAYCPYGTKTPQEINARSATICRFLLAEGAKMIVVACNTASIAGLDLLRQLFTVPIVGMEPAIKPASLATRNGKIGVMATGVTINGDRFHSLLEKYSNGVTVYTQPCPGLVEAVENGQSSAPATRLLLQKYLAPMLAAGVDTIVLGCTHYPFLRETVQKICGPEVKLIDTGQAVARQVERVLKQHDLQHTAAASGRELFYTSGDPEAVGKVISTLWGKQVQVQKKSI
ncbi:MAG: glutamate racemase [Bacillota bacterium]|uniref:glutamate racemase n=1 Tax=Desulfurispora thermophila TaxID=265470 RepID=UPI00037DB0E5|nr:glutamate racemase [Desulfurispora thermophila]